ncbi:cobalamin B12-binding domain-containing protein [Methylobacterium symbioticum]|uniref:B12-binding domain-containing protein n=1 Tax=Methylobacterium symbioticum TaxID=2584084 RepID=A0A509EIF3_9HYPH|nr:cobalamin-dependent protein [Methylobacterium symbioticum]VUD74166.1 hypothetical protein MET9862_04794 [Methylobacterium symbioticum]
MGDARCYRWDPGDLAFDCALLDFSPALSVGRPPLDRPDVLAGLIEGEILPRLMLVHAQASAPRAKAPRRPTPEEAARFAALLLSPGPLLSGGDDVRPAVADLLSRGLPLESLLADLLAPAARHLGSLWEEDACDFLAVTTALGRLQVIARMLCARLETEAPPRGRSVLLLPCPGETHVFGLVLAASAFRQAGWTVGLPDGGSGVLAVAREPFDVVGLSLASDVYLPALAPAIAALRAASCNPELRILVGGAYFARHPGQVAAVGADACAMEAASAPDIAESLLEIQARAC